MANEEWQPTMRLRWSKDGKLQQAWWRETVEYRKYGGVERRCVGSDSEWREIPTEQHAEHHADKA